MIGAMDDRGRSESASPTRDRSTIQRVLEELKKIEDEAADVQRRIADLRESYSSGRPAR